ncbi:cell division transport system permease protein [Sphingomonas sp. SORGH_AS 950]|uniref:cell division protein FtsX n=1 Tax=Sphingomonas sp. SORGH_AS_0950 TaxID=3041792 RepID=UPI00278B9DFB|nr:FtsX-like permease family protein [Sphingomonas sp. SORGH_AS_0950]MDQ1157776.1 cell division transport system permease protein [Sphingomonas sp. SORGH_AS_0950]
MAGRLTVQIVEGEAGRRDAAAARVLAVLRRLPDVARATPVPQAELARMLQPWLGTDAEAAGLPVPALIDVDLTSDDSGAVARVGAAVTRASPAARVDAHATWLGPVGRLLDTAAWLAGAIILLMLGATTAVVMLAARAGLEAHRGTIEVIHMLGATDRQVARLFQRRIALDAGIGAAVGGIAAAGAILLIARQVGALESELLGNLRLGAGDMGMLVLLPFAFVLLAVVAARAAVLAQMRRML